MASANTIIDQAIVRFGVKKVRRIAISLGGTSAIYARHLATCISKHGLGPQQTVAAKFNISTTRVSQSARALAKAIEEGGDFAWVDGRCPIWKKAVAKDPRPGIYHDLTALTKEVSNLRGIIGKMTYAKRTPERTRFTPEQESRVNAREMELIAKMREVDEWLGRVRDLDPRKNYGASVVPTAGLDGNADGGKGIEGTLAGYE